MAQKSRSDYTMLNMVSGLGGYVVTFVLGLVCRMAFTRVFSAEYLGINGLFSNVLSMLSLAELGMANAIVYALYSPLAKNDHSKIASYVRFYGKFYRVVALVVLTIGLLIMPFLKFIIKEPPSIDENIYVLYLISLFNTVSGYLFVYRNSLLCAAQKSYIINSVSNIMIIVQNVVQIILMFVFKNYIIYMLVISVFSMLTNAINSEIAKKQYPCINDKNAVPLTKEEKKSLSSNVRALAINRIGGLLVNSTDNIIISAFNGLSAVGLSSNYTLFSTNITTVLNTVFTSSNASVGNFKVLNDTEKSYGLFKALNLANFWMYSWAAIGIFVVSTDMVSLLFGSEYVLPIEIPLIIAVNFYMVGMQKAVWSYLNIYGIFRPGRYVPFVTAILNIAFSLWLGKLWGLFGIFLASAISRALTNTWYSPYALFKHAFKMSSKKYFAKYLYYAVILAAVAFLCWFICSLFNFSAVVNVILKILVCCVVPNGVLLILFGKSDEFSILKSFLKKVIAKITGIFKKIKIRSDS